MGAPPARDAWRKFTENYGNPRTGAARALCVDFLAAKNTVQSVLKFRSFENVFLFFLLFENQASRSGGRKLD
jgi:hypothetical protein